MDLSSMISKSSFLLSWSNSAHFIFEAIRFFSKISNFSAALLELKDDLYVSHFICKFANSSFNKTIAFCSRTRSFISWFSESSAFCFSTYKLIIFDYVMKMEKVPDHEVNTPFFAHKKYFGENLEIVLATNLKISWTLNSYIL